MGNVIRGLCFQSAVYLCWPAFDVYNHPGELPPVWWSAPLVRITPWPDVSVSHSRAAATAHGAIAGVCLVSQSWVERGIVNLPAWMTSTVKMLFLMACRIHRGLSHVLPSPPFPFVPPLRPLRLPLLPHLLLLRFCAALSSFPGPWFCAGGPGWHFCVWLNGLPPLVAGVQHLVARRLLTITGGPRLMSVDVVLLIFRRG